MTIKIVEPKSFHKIRKWIVSIYWKKRTVLAIVVLVLLSVLLKSTVFSGSSEEYSFDTVETGTVTQIVTVNGNVTVAGATDVFSPTSGVLEEVFVKNGDKVAKGDALFAVKSTATVQEQAAAFAGYQTALNTLNTAQNTKLALDATMWTKQKAYLDAQNTQIFRDNNVINPATGKSYTNLEKQSIDSAVIQAQKDFAAAEQTYKTADVAIADGRAQVNAALLTYQATQTTTITAPISGTIHNLIGSKGARVEGKTSPAAVLIIADDTTEYTIKTAVSEVYASKVKLGQPVTILFNGLVNKVYKGRVIQIDTFGTNNQGVITYNVFMNLDSIDDDIKPGMSAILKVKAAEKHNILTAANAAIVPYEGEKAVQVLNKKGEIDFLPVKVGLRGNSRSEIISGVDEGTEIIIGNTEYISQGGGSFSLGE